jgi:hypothetical protein
MDEAPTTLAGAADEIERLEDELEKERAGDTAQVTGVAVAATAIGVLIGIFVGVKMTRARYRVEQRMRSIGDAWSIARQ